MNQIESLIRDTIRALNGGRSCTKRMVRFQGRELVLAGMLKYGGALVPLEDYQAGRMSFAHLFPNGEIKRFGKVIGTRKDLVLLRRSLPEE